MYFRKYLFVWLSPVLAVVHGIDLCCRMHLVPRAGIEPRPPPLGLQNLSRRSTGNGHSASYIYIFYMEGKSNTCYNIYEPGGL